MVSFAQAKTPVLVIHSYHPDFEWSNQVNQGLQEGLEGTDVEIQTVYLDFKRYHSPELFKQLKALYRIKLAEHNYRAILTVDNAALNLVNEMADVVGSTPVIFSGLNQYSRERYKNIDLLTGVNEVVSLPDNLQLMSKLHPDAKRVYVILDETPTSEEYWRMFLQQLENMPSLSMDVVPWQGLNYQELMDNVRQVKKDELIYFLSFFKDGDNNYIGHENLLESLSETASVPVYGAGSFMLKYGLAGGVMVDGVTQGWEQAALLKQILANPDSKMPPVIDGKPLAKLSFHAIERFSLDKERVSGVEVALTPASILKTNPKLAAISVLLVLFLCLVIAGLIYLIQQYRHNAKALAESQALFKGVFDQSNQFIALLAEDGVVISANEAFYCLYPMWNRFKTSPIWTWKEWLNADELKKEIVAIKDTGTRRFEVRILSQLDTEVILDVALKSVEAPDDNRHQVLFEARDITQRKLTEQKLQRSEAEYRMLYDQQPVMLLTIDRQSRIQSINECVTEWLGYAKRELLGHKVTDFYRDEVSSPYELVTKRSQSGDKIWRREICYVNCYDEEIWIRESIRTTQVKSQLLLVGEDITNHRRMESMLRHQALRDPLTDLYNRNHFERILTEKLRSVNEEGLTHALFYIDLDQFRVINDTLGHEAGDKALKFTARKLLSLLPDEAIVARLGGDEFAIICSDCDDQEALEIGHHVLEQLNETELYWNRVRMSLACSIGVRLLDRSVSSPQQAHAQADTACYAAKDKGRARLHVYRQDDEEVLRREREMAFVNQIHSALSEDRFEIYAQPIVPVADNRNGKMYFEILVRLRDEHGDMVPNGLFIPAAERYNIAHLIDAEVVRKTLRWFQENPEYVERIGMISLNLSGRSMVNDGFVSLLMSSIKSSVIPSENLCFEVTETAAISNMSDAIEVLTSLKALGCSIALDDFGSGLSSFGYLRQLPIDLVKIDGQFVCGIDEDETDFLIVKAIQELAHQMGKKTVAEFVESREILSRLETLGVDYAQGYHLGRPQPMVSLVKSAFPEIEQVS
ncbi:diguanylate cyclase [Veronia pacifica]|uniref:Diguanylate cyclase n=2 Tax=Veronia pacifica TaxID=1080227 RepID=A0A1C3EJS3_9GAMM|nr:diguanylate cyclase [Veronia pacifica]